MGKFLHININFLHLYFNGKGNKGKVEWPPSPLRLFQALLESAARGEQDMSCLAWVETLAPPDIYACSTQSTTGHTTYVPDNVRDKKKNGKLTEKRIQPLKLIQEDTSYPSVQYVFPFDEQYAHLAKSIIKIARSVTHLGWGIDVVVGNAVISSRQEIAKGEHWIPSETPTNNMLRIPCTGTLQALKEKHESFLMRTAQEGVFIPVPPLIRFKTIGYRRPTDLPPKKWISFGLLHPDTNNTGFRSFSPIRQTRIIAGMVRHACADIAEQQQWEEDTINTFIHGKTNDGRSRHAGMKNPERFSYIPLPTINPRLQRTESIRRILLSVPSHCQKEIDWANKLLPGTLLKDERSQEPQALLSVLPKSDWVTQQYTGSFTSWSTVTPVILPGHDDHKRNKTEKLLRTAFKQSGFSDSLIESLTFEWRGVGFRLGTDLASKYLPPANLNNRSRYHVRIIFPHAVEGPIAIGSGRFRGFGVFAGDS